MRSKAPALVLLVLAACHSSSDSDPVPEPTSLVVNLGLAAVSVSGTGALRLVAASEEGEGRDLDGDGDKTGVVLQILDLERGSQANTALAFPRRLPFDHDPPLRSGSNDSFAVFQVSEEETGRDLDEDGIPGEVTTWTFDRRTGALTNLSAVHGGLAFGDDLFAFFTRDEVGNEALNVFDGRDGSLTTLPIEPAVLLAPSNLLAAHGSTVAFTRDEAGVFDLNADGDASDFAVLHLYDADSGRVVNTSFAIWPGTLTIQDGFAGFGVSESQQGGLDLNGDGDADDVVFVAVEATNGLTRIPGFDAGFDGESFAAFFDPDSKGFLLTVPEKDLDRNGDGDTADLVALLYEPRSDRIFDTALAVPYSALVQAGAWIGVPVGEQEQGELDLDRDGRIESSVPHVFDTRTGRSVNLGFRGSWLAGLEQQLLGLRVVIDGDVLLESELFAWDPRARRVRRTGVDVLGVLGSSGDRALVHAAETTEDLNGDGDRLDFVLAVYEGSTGTVRSLRVATSSFGTSSFVDRLAPGGMAVVLVPEAAQGVDLNGDGDLLDQVLHQIFLDAPGG